jgi:galactokinase
VSRSLENTAYAERRTELERALRLVGAARSTDVETTALDGLEEIPKRRLRHVVGENERVRRFAAALEAGDLDAAGALLGESHASLRDDYEVSLPELDLLVDLAADAGALGARLLGGGFGGSVLLLAHASRAADVGDAVAARYRERTGTGGEALLVRASPGASCRSR